MDANYRFQSQFVSCPQARAKTHICRTIFRLGNLVLAKPLSSFFAWVIQTRLLEWAWSQRQFWSSGDDFACRIQAAVEMLNRIDQQGSDMREIYSEFCEFASLLPGDS